MTKGVEQEQQMNPKRRASRVRKAVPLRSETVLTPKRQHPRTRRTSTTRGSLRRRSAAPALAAALAKLASARSRPVTTGAVGDIAVTLQAKRTDTIPVVATFHQQSPHVLKLNQTSTPISPDVLRQEAIRRRSAVRVFRYVNEVSVVSAVAFVYWGIVRLSGSLFQIPKEMLPLMAFDHLPQTIQDPLVAFRGLPTRPFDAVTIAPRRDRQRRLQEHVRLSSAPTPLLPRIAAFSAVALLLIAPFAGLNTWMSLQGVRAEVLGVAEEGVAEFIAASEHAVALDFDRAADRFAAAGTTFDRAQRRLNSVPLLLRTLAPLLPQGGELRSGEALLDAAVHATSAGVALSDVFSEAAKAGGIGTSAFWQSMQAVVSSVTADVVAADEALQRVDPAHIPESYRERFAQASALVHGSLRQSLADANDVAVVAPALLGVDAPRRYLFVFQNNHELRGGGGFMGSFAVVQVRHGAIESFTMPGGGTYDLQGSLLKQVSAPEPLRLINPRWEMQDANWWSDWPTSAKKIHWFYQWSGGETVDGVIAIDTDIMEEFLRITGPIPLPTYGVTVTADNFVAETTEQVEILYDREKNTPKQFLADLAPLLIARLQQHVEAQPLSLLPIVERAFAEKHLLVYSHAPDIQERLVALGWSGSLQPLAPGTDTLGIVHTNIGGAKTDGVIRDRVTHDVAVEQDGALVTSVTLTRTHTGVKGDPFTGVQNNDYVRFYVPEGSRLVAASGFRRPDQALFEVPGPHLAPDVELQNREQFAYLHDPSGMRVWNEFGRTVFADWIQVKPGESATATLTYVLPWAEDTMTPREQTSWFDYFEQTAPTRQYRFLWEKQPGTDATEFTHTFLAADVIDIMQPSSAVQAAASGWSLDATLRENTPLTVYYRTAL